MTARAVTYRYRMADGTVAEGVAHPTQTVGLYVAGDGSTGNAWRVIHYRSGAYLGYSFGSPEAALAMANTLNDVTDWTRRIGDFINAPRVVDRIHDAAAGAGGERMYGGVPGSYEMDNEVPVR